MKKILTLTALAVVLTASPALAEGGEDGHGHPGHKKGGMFKAADTNEDGVISRSEFSDFHQKVFDKMDINGDGQITREEQQQRRAEWKEKMKDKMQERHDRRMDRLDKLGGDEAEE